MVTKALMTYLREVAIWIFVKPRLVWLTVGAILFTHFLGRFLADLSGASTWEPRIRLWGMLLEILGLGTVIYGLLQTGRLFERVNMLSIARKWISTFPRRQGSRVIHTASGNLIAGGATAVGFASSALGPSATLEERIARLEKSQSQLEHAIHAVDSKVDAEALKRQAELALEQRAREAANLESRALIERVAAEDVFVELMGSSWLFFGITLATASQEIASYFT